MTGTLYLSADFSGIQNYVLAIKSSGKAQAKRLRARSARVELFERAALWTVREKLGIQPEEFNDRVIVIGGGGFQIKLAEDTDTAHLDAINSELQRRLWEETGGELQFSMAWAETHTKVRRELENRKRQQGAPILQKNGYWNSDSLSRPPFGESSEVGGKACQVCERKEGIEQIQDDDDEDEQGIWHCYSCKSAQMLGRRLTDQNWTWIRPGSRAGQTSALGVNFNQTTERQPGAFHAVRWIPQNERREPMTFEEIAKKSRGVRRLAVLKADVDDMGQKVADIVKQDPSLDALKAFNRELDTFFGQTMYNYLKESWPYIYTIYSGGDDLLMVGPWDIILDFAGELRKKFRAGSGGNYRLSFSAGIALTPYRIPIRHAVESADELETKAKSHEGKDRCAALDTDWRWDYHDVVIGDGKKLAEWIEVDRLPRSLIHRLLAIADTEDSPGKELRSAHWTYQVSRNAPQHQHREFREWAMDKTDWLAPDAKREEELKLLTASFRYALLSTRTASKEN